MPNIKDLIQQIKVNQSLHKHQLEEIERKRKEHKTLKTTNDDIVSKEEEIKNILLAVKLLLEKITYGNKVMLEAFATEAMQKVFTDKNYSIELEVREDTKRPAINILLVENGVKQDIRDSVGGGIVTTLGLLFQIYYLEVYELNKVLFIDEGLKEVSKTKLGADTNIDYLSNLLQFLKDLSKERGYKIVVITHDESVREIADVVYRVKDGEVDELKM